MERSQTSSSTSSVAAGIRLTQGEIFQDERQFPPTQPCASTTSLPRTGCWPPSSSTR